MGINADLERHSRPARVVKRICDFRGDHESLRGFARRIAVNPQTLVNWERGAVPDDDTLLRIAEKLGTTFLWLKLGMGPVEDAEEFWEEKTGSLWICDLAGEATLIVDR